MAQVLDMVLTAGLDAVLVAVELALEAGPPGKAERGNGAANGGHALEDHHAAVGGHGTLRQPAW